MDKYQILKFCGFYIILLGLFLAGEITVIETAPVQAQESAPAEGSDAQGRFSFLQYEKKGEEIIITSYQGKPAELNIPAQIDGCPVTAIGEKAFDSYRSLKAVTLPDSLTAIGNGAFSYCTSLASILISPNSAAIGQGAFTGCDSLKSIILPESVTIIKKTCSPTVSL